MRELKREEGESKRKKEKEGGGVVDNPNEFVEFIGIQGWFTHKLLLF